MFHCSSIRASNFFAFGSKPLALSAVALGRTSYGMVDEASFHQLFIETFAMVATGAAVEYKTALPKADPKPAPTGPRDIPSPATEDAPETSNQDQVKSSCCKVTKPFTKHELESLICQSRSLCNALILTDQLLFGDHLNGVKPIPKGKSINHPGSTSMTTMP